MTTQEKIAALRTFMNTYQIDAWIVPSADPHQSEYMADHWKIRAWLSGFTGSAGTLVVTPDRAGLWTDSRYFLQAEQELADSGIDLFKLKMPGVPDHIQWLAALLPQGARLGFDGNVVSVAQVQKLRNALQTLRVQFFYQQDLAAELWTERPAIPAEPVFLLDDRFCGESRVSKFSRVRAQLVQQKATAHLISPLDEIAWLLNLRGRDIDYNPVTISYAYISEQEVRLFIDPHKVNGDVRKVLEADGVILVPYHDLFSFLEQLPPESTVLLDPHKTTQIVSDIVASRATVRGGENLVFSMKAIKNPVELEGLRQAHVRDGVAMVKWLYWLDQQIGNRDLTEVTVVAPLEAFRRQGKYFQGLSFHTIAGYQANGAICHYAAKPETALSIKPEGLLLVDSGAQYADGTTDITRTLALAPPTEQQRRDFTLVLKGHIALATAKFPRGTSGAQLDTIARLVLWQQGLNYGHGTGHGIGHFLSVHEGPQSLRPESMVALEPGMVCSNEPGLYREGEYGIRIENLIITIPAEKTAFGTFYQFETVTLCPMDLDLVEPALFTNEERDWLNAYHRTVFEKLVSGLNTEEAAWLRHETREI